MKENLNSQNKEEAERAYEQFDSVETYPPDKKLKKIVFSSKKLIKYILIASTVLCLMILLFNIIQNKNLSNILEFKSKPKKLELPLDKKDIGFKPELKIIENKINLGYSIKGNDIKDGKEQIILINIFITIKRKLSKDNCFDCYPGEEINCPELGDEEAFDKAYKELGLHDTYAKNIYCQKHKPKKPKGDYRNQIHYVWNNYKRKIIPIKGLYYIDDDNAGALRYIIMKIYKLPL